MASAPTKTRSLSFVVWPFTNPDDVIAGILFVQRQSDCGGHIIYDHLQRGTEDLTDARLALGQANPRTHVLRLIAAPDEPKGHGATMTELGLT